jgi:hypothetical protein
MIARVRVLLPYTIVLREGDELGPIAYVERGYNIRILPPMKSAVPAGSLDGTAAIPVSEILNLMDRLASQDFDERVKMDGRRTLRANILQVEFARESFNRSDAQAPGQFDPPADLILETVNRFLERLRVVSKAGFVKSLADQGALWVIDYLKDDGSELEKQVGLFRSQYAVPLSWQLVGINTLVWDRIGSLPRDFSPSPWETLLLDAEALLPEVGPAVVLGATSLETLISNALDELVKHSGTPAVVWDWLNQRSDRRQNPSVEEQYDSLLSALSGRSLRKDDPGLWKAMLQLKAARNSFVHDGIAMVEKQPVTTEKATALLEGAAQVMAWVEALLPPGLRSARAGIRTAFQFGKRM